MYGHLEGSLQKSFTWQVRGGLTFREGHYICEAIAETGLLAALDLMVRDRYSRDLWRRLSRVLQEVNPSLKSDFDVRETVSVGCSLVRSALGTPRVFFFKTRYVSSSLYLGETLL